MNATTTIPLHSNRGMPIIGLGTWQMTDAKSTVLQALNLGYRMIDTSGDYGTQPGIGEALQETPVDREDIFLVTKVEEGDDAYEATRQNLLELQQDYVDLMLIHRPPKDSVGEDLWQGLIKAKREGLVRDIGVSNYSVNQLRTLMDSSDEIPVVNQIEWSPFGYSDDMLKFCRDNHIVIQAYSPLTRQQRLRDKTLAAIAMRHRKTPAQILLRWNLQLGLVPIPKANQRRHQEEDIDVFDFELSQDDMAVLSNLNEAFSALASKPMYM